MLYLGHKVEHEHLVGLLIASCLGTLFSSDLGVKWREV